MARGGGEAHGAGRDVEIAAKESGGGLFLVLVFMLCLLAGLAGGFLALMLFRLAGGTN